MNSKPHIAGKLKNLDDAYELFSQWYEKCIEAGIEPEDAVAMMGGMALITHEEIIEFLVRNDKLTER